MAIVVQTPERQDTGRPHFLVHVLIGRGCQDDVVETLRVAVGLPQRRVMILDWSRPTSTSAKVSPFPGLELKSKPSRPTPDNRIKLNEDTIETFVHCLVETGSLERTLKLPTPPDRGNRRWDSDSRAPWRHLNRPGWRRREGRSRKYTHPTQRAQSVPGSRCGQQRTAQRRR